MNLRWSLDELYTSFESEEFKRDLEICFQKIKNIKDWANINLDSKDNAVRKIEEYLNMQIDFKKLFSRLLSFANLTFSVEARNELALKNIDKLQVKNTELTQPSVNFQKWLGSIENLDEIIASSEFLKEHRFHLTEIAEQSKYLLSEKEEIVISKLTNTGSKSWEKLQNQISSTLLVDITIDGEEKQLPLSMVRNMAFNKNLDIRKAAYEAELKAYKKIEESSAACINGIKGEVLTLSEMRGFDSPLEETLFNARMDRETLDAMLSAMKESLPSFHKYYRKKAELLGHKNGLPFYDMFAPMGEVEMKFTYEEARDYVVKNFRKFSDKLADFADNAFENRWIDAEPREGKRGGAFCSNLRSIKESRILANFNGSFTNMNTLAHELGHGYHGSCIFDETILNSVYTMPLAETASIFCETIVKSAALRDSDKKEAFVILETALLGAGQVIVDIYCRYLFESALFDRRKNHSLSVKELNEIMIEAQKKAYGDSLDHDYLHPYMWANKPHYYFPARNFYNFPYAFGLLFAKGLYAEYLNRGEEFIKDYDKLLAATGKNSVADVAMMMGIDIKSIDFWRNSLKLIEEDIARFIELSETVEN